jgi:hypothetical protein
MRQGREGYRFGSAIDVFLPPRPPQCHLLACSRMDLLQPDDGMTNIQSYKQKN